MLLNPSPIRRFYWYEPWAFARARAAAERRVGGAGLAAVLSLMFAIPLLVGSLPETAKDWSVVAAIAVSSGLLVSFGLLPLVSRLPNDIAVMTDSFVIGRDRISFFDVKHAVVGTTPLGKKVFPVLSFTTRGGQQYLFGLSPKVNPQELADFLERVGVREPHA
jgi:hypothetical protein